MLETLRIISYMVWIGVGLTTIGGSIWGLWFYNKLWKNVILDKSNKNEVGE